MENAGRARRGRRRIRALGRHAFALVATTTAATAIAALAPAVSSARTVTYPDVGLTPTGSVTYTWTASPALGCAAVGVCGLQGAVTIGISQADFQAGPNGGLTIQTTGVARTEGPAPGTSCVDPLDAAGFGINLPLRPVREMGFSFGPTGPSSGRCAGPLPQDLARLALPVRRHGHVFDLRADQTEVSGPYDVTLQSSLILHPQADLSGFSTSSSGGGFIGGGNGGRRRLTEHVVLVDGLAPSSGSLQVNFSAAPEPFCLGLGACGSTGTISLSLGAPERPLTTTATEDVARRLSPAAALRAFATGREIAFAQLRVPVTVTETISTPGQPTCTDQLSDSLELQLQNPGSATFALQDASGSVVRSACPGPLETDAIPGDSGAPSIATGTIPRRALLAPRANLVLTRQTGFANSAWSGRWSGQLGLTFVRRSLRVFVTGGGRG